MFGFTFSFSPTLTCNIMMMELKTTVRFCLVMGLCTCFRFVKQELTDTGRKLFLNLK